MNRHQRMTVAHETLSILDRGQYTLDDNRTIELSEHIAACLGSTRYIDAEEANALPSQAAARRRRDVPATVEVVNQTTLACISRVLNETNGSVAALNFASARNPGGGFLGGSLAQEESLASSSALYASLLCAPQFYETHRASSSLLYSDSMIVSPGCPVFRRDDGSLMHEPELVTFITCAAPNAGAVEKNQPGDLALVPDVLRARSERVLAVAALQDCATLVLGAWGCGVFRNDPAVVAGTFRSHLYGDAAWASHFERIVFAVLDTSVQQDVYGAFLKAFAR